MPSPVNAILAARRAIALNVLAFLGVFGVYLATATWHGWQSVDTLATLVPGWQLAHHGNLTLDHIHIRGHVQWFIHSGGRTVSNRFPGSIFLTVPFFWLFGRDQGPTIPPAAAAAAFVTALAVVAMFHVLRRLTDVRTALVATGVFAFATATWSVSADAIWTHGPAQLCLLLAVLAIARERWLLAGLACGAAVLMRPQLGVVAVVLGLYLAWRTRSLRPAVMVALGTAVGVGLLLTYDAMVFGHTSPTAVHPVVDAVGVTGNGLQAERFFFFRNVFGTLFSPTRGLLLMTPVVIPLLPGLVRAWRAAEPWVRAAALAGIVYMLVQLNVNTYTGGDSFFGSRLTIEWLTLSVPLLLLSWREWACHYKVSTAAVVTLTAISLGIHSLAAMFYEPPGIRYGPGAAVVVAVLVLLTFLALKAVDREWSSRAAAADARDEPVQPKVVHETV